MKLKFSPPTIDTPGYVRRAKKTIELSNSLNKLKKAGEEYADPKLFDDLVDFLVEYIEEPKDRNEAKEALYDASQTQFTDMLNALMGGGQEAIPPTSETAS